MQHLTTPNVVNLQLRFACETEATAMTDADDKTTLVYRLPKAVSRAARCASLLAFAGVPVGMLADSLGIAFAMILAGMAGTLAFVYEARRNGESTAYRAPQAPYDPYRDPAHPLFVGRHRH